MFFLSKNETFSAIPNQKNPLFIIRERSGTAWSGHTHFTPQGLLYCDPKPNLMQQEDDLRALEKVVQFMRGISILFAVLNIYWFCHG